VFLYRHFSRGTLLLKIFSLSVSVSTQDEDRQHDPVQRQEETLAPHQAKAVNNTPRQYSALKNTISLF
jgi:hypothetical protein